MILAFIEINIAYKLINYIINLINRAFLKMNNSIIAYTNIKLFICIKYYYFKNACEFICKF